MAINFVNPITAGTVLVRSAIQSQNYIQNSSGWKVAQDGTAEFNNVTVRGTVTGSTINGGTITGSTISGGTVTGTTISGGTITGTTVSGGTVTGTTVTGSTIITGSAPNAQVNITSDAGRGTITFPSNRTSENSSAYIRGGVVNAGLSNEFLAIDMVGATTKPNTGGLIFQINSQPVDGSSEANVQVYSPGSPTTILDIRPSQLSMSAPLAINQEIVVIRNSTSDYGVTFNLNGDSQLRSFITGNGTIWWGDGTNAVDTNLYRGAANTIRTDDSIAVGVNVFKVNASWTSPTMGTGWATGSGIGGSYPPLKWRYDAEDNIHLFGTFHATTTSPNTVIASGFPNVSIGGNVGVAGAIQRINTANVSFAAYLNDTGQFRSAGLPTIAANDTYMVNAIIPIGNLS